MKPVAFVVIKLGFHLRVVGAEHVPRAGGCLLASNHASYLDPVVVGAGAPRPLHFLAKAELFRVPLLGPLIRGLNAHPLERDGADVGAVRTALALLRRGHAVLVFPEGTRGREGELRSGKPGVGMLASAAEVPVVPTCVRGTGRALPRGARWVHPSRITVAYGPPIRFPRVRGRDRYQEFSDAIMAAIGRVETEAEVVAAPREGRPTASDNAQHRARGRSPASR